MEYRTWEANAVDTDGDYSLNPQGTHFLLMEKDVKRKDATSDYELVSTARFRSEMEDSICRDFGLSSGRYHSE